MKCYREEQKALKREKALQRERAAVKRAVRRLATVERWESEHPGEVDEKLLHLRWHLGQVFAEEAVKAKEQKKRRKREAGAGVLKKSVVKTRVWRVSRRKFSQ